MCPLCEELEESGEVLYTDELASVVLHPDWACLGHAMIVAKSHVENLSDLDPEQLEGFTRLVGRAERTLLAETGADRAILMKLGIAVPHLHLHLYPVNEELDRDAVMKIIDGNVRVERDDDFIERVRRALAAM